MTPVLAADRLVFGYGPEPVLRDVSLAVAPGELVGIIGPNGGGKTTLVRLLSGVARPQAGTIALGGRTMATLRRREIARRIGVVPQDPHLDFPFTVLEVVLMGRAPHAAGPFVLPGAHDVALARSAMARLDVGSVERRSLDQLSGGERQRVLLARALAQEPEVLLLDEPTTHLDLRHQVGIYDVVRTLARERGLAVVSVLHDLNLAALYCDRLILLAGGRVAREGRAADVLTVEILTAAYGTPVHVGRIETTGSPVVVPLPREHVPG